MDSFSGNVLRVAPQPAVCALCGAWFYSEWQARYCSTDCAETAYTAFTEAKTTEQRRNELAGMVSRGIMDPCAADLFGVEPDRETDALTGMRGQVMRDGCVATSAWLSGGPGTGKTFACVWAMLEGWTRHGQTIAHVSGRRLLRDGDRGEHWREYGRVEVLLVDDLDKSVPTDTAASVLWEILDTRRNRKLFTLVTANVTGGQWARTWESDVSLRWIQPSMDRLLPCVGIRCDGKNLRREVAKEV
jgi:DNA replication protein DnaC